MFFGIVLVATLLFFLIFGTPIAVSVGLATILAMLTAGDTAALPAITQKMFTSIDSFPLLALPLFTLSGELMEISGIDVYKRQDLRGLRLSGGEGEGWLFSELRL